MAELSMAYYMQIMEPLVEVRPVRLEEERGAIQSVKEARMTVTGLQYL